MEDEFGQGVFFGFLLTFAMVTWPVGCGSMDYYRTRAVENGAAEWVMDPKTGGTEFVWKDDKEKTK